MISNDRHYERFCAFAGDRHKLECWRRCHRGRAAMWRHRVQRDHRRPLRRSARGTRRRHSDGRYTGGQRRLRRWRTGPGGRTAGTAAPVTADAAASGRDEDAAAAHAASGRYDDAAPHRLLRHRRLQQRPLARPDGKPPPSSTAKRTVNGFACN